MPSVVKDCSKGCALNTEAMWLIVNRRSKSCTDGDDESSARKGGRWQSAKVWRQHAIPQWRLGRDKVQRWGSTMH